MFQFTPEITMNWLDGISKTIARKFAELSPSCKAAIRLQSEALDHKLTLPQRLGLRIHLVLCLWCRRYGKQIALVHDAAHSHSDEMVKSVPQQLSEKSRERIRQKLRANIE
jgi:hypothetical protein